MGIRSLRVTWRTFTSMEQCVYLLPCFFFPFLNFGCIWCYLIWKKKSCFVQADGHAWQQEGCYHPCSIQATKVLQEDSCEAYSGAWEEVQWEGEKMISQFCNYVIYFLKHTSYVLCPIASIFINLSSWELDCSKLFEINLASDKLLVCAECWLLQL